MARDTDVERLLLLEGENRVGKVQFCNCMIEWDSEAFKKKSRVASQNRAKRLMEHKLGTKSIVRLGAEMQTALERPVQMIDILKATYVSEGKQAPAKNVETVTRLTDMVSRTEPTQESETGPASSCMSSDEVLSQCMEKVFGWQKFDRVRLRGIGVNKRYRVRGSSEGSSSPEADK